MLGQEIINFIIKNKLEEEKFLIKDNQDNSRTIDIFKIEYLTSLSDNGEEISNGFFVTSIGY